MGKTISQKSSVTKRTSQLHINPKLHKKFKGFCIDKNRTMQEVTEKLIIDEMKCPVVTRLTSDRSERV
jgi:hypothetical protein